MGIRPSSLSKDEVEEILKVTHLTQKEIYRLWKRYCQLDKKGEGYLTEDCFLAIPEVAMNPLESKIFTVFDYERTGRISFKQFVRTLSAFSRRATPREKLDILFRIYDVDGGGISREQLFDVLELMVGSQLTDTQLRNIVEEAFAEMDISQKGVIDFHDFQHLLGDSESLRKMVISFG